MRPPNVRGVVVKLVALLLLAVIAGSLMWAGAEQHYRACMEERFFTGTGTSVGAGGVVWLDDPPSPPPPLRTVSVDGCSRWPL